MSLTINITDVKNIQKLEFLVPSGGVFVLAGENGSGKTTLLACLARIGFSDSFPRHFRTSNVSSKLDQYDKAKVEYAFSESSHSVTYAYSGTRWEPTPKKNSATLLANSGFSEVLYVAADEARVTPRREDFRPNKIKSASPFIQTNANLILGTQKFTSLRTVNVKRGTGQQAFVLEIGPTAYVSERNFSLGELAILKLFRALETCQERALVVIDELELALHPVAQERLLQVLEGIAKQKELTVIFSTHSATLIRSVNPKKLIFLEKRLAGTVVCVTPCYATYALGRIAPPTDLKPEIVLLVEDREAQTWLQALMRKAIGRVYPHSVPSIVCQPVGGYAEVLRFFSRGTSIFGPGTRAVVALDADCQSLFAISSTSGTTVSSSVASDLRQIYLTNQASVKFLPETPEVGLINEIAAADQAFREAASGAFTNNALLTNPIHPAVGPSTSAAARSQAKIAIANLLSTVCAITGRTEDEVRRFLYEWLVDRLDTTTPGRSAAILGPIIR